jgi:hypothetical protein
LGAWRILPGCNKAQQTLPLRAFSPRLFLLFSRWFVAEPLLCHAGARALRQRLTATGEPARRLGAAHEKYNRNAFTPLFGAA